KKDGRSRPVYASYQRALTLECSGASDDQAVTGALDAWINQKLPLPALSPGAAIGRIECDIGNAILVDAICLANDHSAIVLVRPTKQPPDFGKGSPIGIAEVTRHAAPYRRAASEHFPTHADKRNAYGQCSDSR